MLIQPFTRGPSMNSLIFSACLVLHKVTIDLQFRQAESLLAWLAGESYLITSGFDVSLKRFRLCVVFLLPIHWFILIFPYHWSHNEGMEMTEDSRGFHLETEVSVLEDVFYILHKIYRLYDIMTLLVLMHRGESHMNAYVMLLFSLIITLVIYLFISCLKQDVNHRCLQPPFF